MISTPIAESAELPAAALALLEAFQRSYPSSQPALWRGGTGSWHRIHPSSASAAASAAGTASEQPGPLTMVPDAMPPLGLSVNGVAAEAVEFLAASLGGVLDYEKEARSSARELSERYEEINLLYSISEILGSVLSLEAAAERILEEVADVLGARRASVWVFDAADRRLFLAAAVGEEGLAGPIREDDPNSVTARVFRERQPLNLERTVQLPAGTRLDLAPHGQEAFLSVPMNYTPPAGEARTIGVITLIGRRAGPAFTAGDTRLLTAVASQVAAAIEVQRLVRESLSRERLVREMELAHDLQLKLLPRASDFQGMGDVAARCVPANTVGGDFYHLLRLSGDRLGIMIGDVSGHGFSAALIMALTISAAAIYAQEAGPPAEVLRRVHGALINELENTEMYLTVFYGVLEPASGRLTYSNAGHPHAFRIPSDGTAVRLPATNPPLGTIPLDRYGEAVVAWRAGEDLLCLFTDGLSEAFAGGTTKGNGEQRLLEEVVCHRAERSQKILDHLFHAAREVRSDIPPDDRTAVLVRA